MSVVSGKYTSVGRFVIGVLFTFVVCEMVATSTEFSAYATPPVLLLHDENLDGVPDEISGSQVGGAEEPGAGKNLLGSDQCKIDDATCALAVVMMSVPEKTKVALRAKKKCPTRKVKRVLTSDGIIVRQNISSATKKKCKKPVKKPTATPKPKVTATPTGGDPISPAPSPEPTKAPTPNPTATPIRPSTPTPSGGGNAAVGKSFYAQVCTSCHGVKAGKSEQQVLAAMSSVSDHSSVKGLVSSQTAKDIAAYLATVR